MGSKQEGRDCLFLLVILIIFSTNTPNASLIDADYYLHSLDQPELCIEGGAPRKNAAEIIFHNGTLGTSTCESKPEQQWHIQKQQNSEPDFYNITSGAWEAMFSQRLYANITGFFMKYWPNPIELIPVVGNNKNKSPVNGSVFIMRETRGRRGTTMVNKSQEQQQQQQQQESGCYSFMGMRKAVKTAKCDPMDKRQRWRFFLVTDGMVS